MGPGNRFGKPLINLLNTVLLSLDDSTPDIQIHNGMLADKPRLLQGCHEVDWALWVSLKSGHRRQILLLSTACNSFYYYYY